MTILDETQTESISITPPAIQAVRELMDKRDLEGYALRVYIAGGGCSGFQYGMALDDNIRETDLILESDGIKVIIDEVSINYLHGATIDYVDEIMGSGFKIDNPNAMSTCGCGQSFQSAEGDTPSAGGGCNSCN
jgi:iron-sulfur cluster assembly protein